MCFCNFPRRHDLFSFFFQIVNLSFLSKQTDLFPGVSGPRVGSVCPGCSVYSCLSVVWQDWHGGHLVWYVHGDAHQHVVVGVYFLLHLIYCKPSVMLYIAYISTSLDLEMNWYHYFTDDSDSEHFKYHPTPSMNPVCYFCWILYT